MFLFRTMRRSLMPRKTTLYIPSWGWPLLLVQRSRLLILVITAVVLTMIIFLTLHMFQTVPLSKRLTRILSSTQEALQADEEEHIMENGTHVEETTEEGTQDESIVTFH